MYAGITMAIWLMLIPNSNITANFNEIDVFPREVISCPIEEENALDEAEFDLLCRCVEAEAGDQDFIGKCYVVDVILNRAEQWNKSVTEVINEKHVKANGKITWQFEVVMNGRINTVKVSDETRRACEEEIKSRRNTEILYFCMYDWFGSWATYCFKHDGHYFYK